MSKIPLNKKKSPSFFIPHIADTTQIGEKKIRWRKQSGNRGRGRNDGGGLVVRVRDAGNFPSHRCECCGMIMCLLVESLVLEKGRPDLQHCYVFRRL